MPRQMRMWQPEDMVAALQSVKADGLSLRAAARTYGVPPSTLRAKFHGRVPVFARRGPKTYLTDEEEEKIVDWAIKMGRMGLRQTHSDIQKVVKTLLDKDGRENPFVNNTPGRRWWNSFVKRHPNLIHRKRQPTDKARVMVSDQRIEMWFKEFEARLQKERALSMLSEPHRLFDDKKESALDGILSEFSGSASTSAPSTTAPAQPVQSTPSTIPLSEPWSGQLPPDVHVAQTPSGLTQIPPNIIQMIPNNEVTVLSVEYLAAPPGMSQDQRKKKGLPPAAITVAEFFRYLRARRTRENHEEKLEKRRKNRELFRKVETEEDEETDEEDMEEDETAAETTVKEREVAEGTVATPETEQAREERKKREAGRKKKKKEKRKMQQKNKEKVIEIMNSAHDPDSEERRKQLKKEKEKAKKIKQERTEKMKKKKEKMKKKQEKMKKKQEREKKKANSKKTKMEEREEEHEAERLRKDTIIEAKDKVRTKSNIKTITSEGEIYICPACLKSSGENEKWINCDHCVRWLHLSCTSMHLLRGIDLGGFVYRCKFC